MTQDAKPVVVTFGEIMMRLSAPEFRRFEQVGSFVASFAGAEANVASSLAHLGVSTQYVTRLPENDLGKMCVNFLRQQGVGVDYVVRGGERLGLLFLESGAAQRGSKIIYDRANSSFASIEPAMIDWRAVLAGAGWFHSTGITPAVSRAAAETCTAAMAAARDLGLKVSCDLNYRAKLWTWGKSAREVMPALVRNCDVVLGNEEDAEKVLGITAQDVDVSRGKVGPEQYIVVCEELVKQFPNLSTVAITLRGSLGASHNTWSAVLWHEGMMYFAPTYDIVPIVDRVGGGDAFAAGLIYGLGVSKKEPQAALDFAVAASCLKHSVWGDVNLVTLAEVEALVAGNASGRVAR